MQHKNCKCQPVLFTKTLTVSEINVLNLYRFCEQNNLSLFVAGEDANGIMLKNANGRIFTIPANGEIIAWTKTPATAANE